jgi:hypothetical protein
LLSTKRENFDFINKDFEGLIEILIKNWDFLDKFSACGEKGQNPWKYFDEYRMEIIKILVRANFDIEIFLTLQYDTKHSIEVMGTEDDDLCGMSNEHY